MPIEIYGRIFSPDEAERECNEYIEYDILFIHLKIRWCGDKNFAGIYSGCGRGDPDPVSLAGYVAALTCWLKFLVGHRTDFIAPTLVPRKIVALHHLTSGNLAIQTVAEGVGRSDRPEVQALPATQRRLRATALVGTAGQTSDRRMQYYAVGVDHFLLNGFDTIHDVRQLGKELIPPIRLSVDPVDGTSRQKSKNHESGSSQGEADKA